MNDKFKKQPHHLIFEELLQQGITLGITTRANGLSKYPENAFNMARYIEDNANNITQHQIQLAKEIGFDRDEWVFPIQTHENKVAHITKDDRGTNIEVLTNQLHGIDAMYTYDYDVLLTMCYADCVPVYFYSPKHHFIALAHAGWRGTYTEIVKEVLNQVDFDLEDLYVVIGPATSSSYEINDDIKNKFETLPINSSNYIETRGQDRHGIDLKKANAELLSYYGVPNENIYTTTYATSEHLNLFFSYRVEKGQTGRMLAFIGQQKQ
ncbi:peptidoglycan editing factor PgeF [Staphylococcus sp. SS35]|nr:peptidoglycan editing factor PgeF [Staphylococcus singaporensis]